MRRPQVHGIGNEFAADLHLVELEPAHSANRPIPSVIISTEMPE